MRLTYTVVFVLDANGWGAYVPDMPGCVSVGDTWEEMLEMTQEALTGHIELTVEDGDPLPEPKMSIEDAITYHLELAADHLGDLGLDFGDPPPTLATRFEPIEIKVCVPESAQSSGAPRSAPVPAR